MSTSALGPDIFIYLLSIAAYEILSRKDLARFCLTSIAFHSLGRATLYKSVTLDSSRPNHRETIVLLERDPFLTSRIQCLELVTTASRDRHNGWFPVLLFKGMARLERLCLVRSALRSVDEKAQFVEIVRESCPLLVELEYRDETTPGVDLVGFPSEGMEIRNLQKLTWNARNWYFASPCRSIILASKETLTHISFPHVLDDFDAEECAPFFTLRFPNLVSFRLGVAYDLAETIHRDFFEGMSEFLIDHPNLEEISLGYCQDDEWATDVVESVYHTRFVALQDRKFHPALKSLDASVLTVNTLLKYAPSTVETLSKLSTGHGMLPYLQENAEDMFRQICDLPSLESLREFRYLPGEYNFVNEEEPWIRLLARKATNLTFLEVRGHRVELDTYIGSVD